MWFELIAGVSGTAEKWNEAMYREKESESGLSFCLDVRLLWLWHSIRSYGLLMFKGISPTTIGDIPSGIEFIYPITNYSRQALGHRVILVIWTTCGGASSSLLMSSETDRDTSPVGCIVSRKPPEAPESGKTSLGASAIRGNKDTPIRDVLKC